MTAYLATEVDQVCIIRIIWTLSTTAAYHSDFPLCVPKTLSGLVERRIGKVGAMIALISFVLAVLASSFKSKSRLEAENAVLRHQLIVLRRKVRGRAQPTKTTAGSSSRCIDGFHQS